MAIHCSSPNRLRQKGWLLCLELIDKMEPTCKDLGWRNSRESKRKTLWLYISAVVCGLCSWIEDGMWSVWLEGRGLWQSKRS